MRLSGRFLIISIQSLARIYTKTATVGGSGIAWPAYEYNHCENDL